MSDYVSREALLRMVGHRPTTPTTDREDRLISAFISTIETFPAADVRPVVYCRECIHWKKSELVICGNDDMVCDYHLGARYCRHADDFCSKGERRADDG